MASSSFPFSSSSKACVTRKWARSRSTCCRDFSGSLFWAWSVTEGKPQTQQSSYIHAWICTSTSGCMTPQLNINCSNFCCSQDLFRNLKSCLCLLWITQEQHFWFHSQTKHHGSAEAIKHQHTYRLWSPTHTQTSHRGEAVMEQTGQTCGKYVPNTFNI